jgi:hypothetical protein
MNGKSRVELGQVHLQVVTVVDLSHGARDEQVAQIILRPYRQVDVRLIHRAAIFEHEPEGLVLPEHRLPAHSRLPGIIWGGEMVGFVHRGIKVERWVRQELHRSHPGQIHSVTHTVLPHLHDHAPAGRGYGRVAASIHAR